MPQVGYGTGSSQATSVAPAAGTVHPITRYGQAVLHRPCAPVSSFGAGLSALVEDMFASMYAAGGVGLAANQIGAGLRGLRLRLPRHHR